MDDIGLTYKEVLTKKPWRIVLPDTDDSRDDATHDSSETGIYMPEDKVYYKIKTQADFVRELFPTAHAIFDKKRYPNIYKKDPESGRWYEQPIQRTAFAFQQLIKIKHTLHLTGNPVKLEIADGAQAPTEEEKDQTMLIKFKKIWLLANMELHAFDAIDAWNGVGDAATVGFIDEDKHFGAKTLSYLNGDILYPHFDSITGKMNLFARKYYDYDEDGVESIEWIEVWDKTYLYRFKKYLREEDNNALENKDADNTLPGNFQVGGYTLVSRKPHGFPFMPVAYCRRDDGPCWSMVQNVIEDYEEAYSYLCENNKAYAFPIFYINGAGEEIDIGGDMNGAAKYITMNDKDAKAGFLNGTDASNAFATQLDKSYNLIYELSFTVKPPELKSGDLPGVALKLLYSPAIEYASIDAKHLQPYIDMLVKMVKYGTGYQEGNTSDYMTLPIIGTIVPYVHQNNTEMVTNLATAVQNGFLSHQTASERCPDFPKNDEYSRIVREAKEKQEQDLLQDIQLQDAQTENNIEEEEAQARINRQQGGSDINNANGQKKNGGKVGRPNKSGIQWDKNRNWPGRNNWDEYDKKK